MLELEFGLADLACTRFAFSPLWEVVASVRVLKSPGEHPLHRPWVTAVLPRLRTSGLDWGMLADLVPVPTRRIPAFVCPPPVSTAPHLEVELATMCATPPGRVRVELADMESPRLQPLRDDPARGLVRLAEVIRDYWAVALAPYWPKIRALLEGDVLHRARLLAEGGAGRLLNDLDPAVRWEKDTLFIQHRHVSGSRELGGRGLLLVPSVFVWPRLFSVTTPPWQPTVRYSPRGVATLWERRATGVPEALAAVLGRSRALLLAELDAPASTTDLSLRTGMSMGGVSQHLTALRAAGLVGAHRSGRYVLYARSEIAEALLAGTGA
ncbi:MULTISPECIES: ArsR/SmtB family transcription factor [Streptosporangium]|uniref:DNA-binding transcriptional ArsR family regulator n=1 Tax=Streptosporangium brasiliense TaxID=47480 RepID=A0ABT9RG80_9ACTN|nr:DUF5937 family protein [Streptosporangium brasiliense]MDP9868118.1 DNA-binding transcriptional ArsR family regulator [Streptosporangium brasiliense]